MEPTHSPPNRLFSKVDLSDRRGFFSVSSCHLLGRLGLRQERNAFANDCSHILFLSIFFILRYSNSASIGGKGTFHEKLTPSRLPPSELYWNEIGSHLFLLTVTITVN